MGKDIPLGRHLRPAARALRRGRRVPRAVRDRPRRQDGRRHRARPRGPQAPVGRARGRRDPVARAAARRHPDHDAASRTARSSPSSTTRRARRSACSRWTSSGCATSPSSTTPRSTSRPTAARRSCSRTSPLDDPTTYELLARGDTLGVFQLDGGPMRALLRSMQPDNFEDISAVIALYRPGPMGANAHNDYADRKNGRKPVDADPPRARRAARRDPRRHLRPDRLPGAGHGDRAEGRRLLARPGRPAAPGDGQEEEGDPGQGVRRRSPPACASNGYSDGRDQDALGHPACRSPTTPSTRRTPPATGWSRTGRRTSRRTTRPSTWPRCSPRSATTRTSRRSTSPSAGGWASRCCRRTSTSPTPTSRRSAPTSGSASPRSATSAPTSSRRSSPAAQEKGAFTDFYDFLRKVDAGRLQQAGRRVADQGRRVRLARAHPARAAARPRRGDRRRSSTSSATRRSASSTCSASATTPRTSAPDRRHAVRSRRRRVGQDDPARASSGRCSASTSPTIRCSASSTCSPPPPTCRSPRSCREAARGGADRHRRRHPVRRSRRGHQAGAPWAQATLEDLDGAVEVMFFPNTYELVGDHIAEDAIVVVRGRTRPPRGHREADRDGPRRSRTCG